MATLESATNCGRHRESCRASRTAFVLAALVLTSMAYAPEKFHAAEPSIGPRMAQAMQLAQQERRQAETRASVAGASQTFRERSWADLTRARDWEKVLREAASTAAPQDADILVSLSQGSCQLIRGGQSAAPRPGAVLREADQLVVIAGQIEIRFHDGSLLILGPATTLRILQGPRSFPQQSTFALDRGMAHWKGGSAAPGLTRLVAPRSLIHLRAGSVDVKIDTDGAAWMSVTEGSADLSARPEAAGISSSEAWWNSQIKLDSR